MLMQFDEIMRIKFFINSSQSTNNRLNIGAPNYGNLNNGIRNGAMYTCDFNGRTWGSKSCDDVVNFDQGGAMGISMTKPNTQSNVVICGSQYQFSCPLSQVEQRLIGVCYNYQFDGVRTLLSSPAPTACPTGSLSVDIIFVLDESTSVGVSNYERGLTWIINVISTFRSDIDSRHVRVGLITYSDNSRTRIQLKSRSYISLTGMVANTGYSRGTTYTDVGINRAVGEFNTRGRSDIPKLMIVITDGRATDPNALRNSARRARSDGIVMSAVGIGNTIDGNELRIIAGIQERVFQVNNFEDLDSILAGLRQVISESGQTTLEGADTNATSELTQIQMGLSSHYSTTGNLYIGAVGAYDRVGSVVDFLASNGNVPTEYSGVLTDVELQTIINPENFTDIKDSYLGYSVTSGNFIGGSIEYVASGSPRYHSKGAVFLYRPVHPLQSSSNFHILHPQTDHLWQLGAYFGHSVHSVDINKDSFDDLLVSAPLYSDTTGYDQGRLFIYMNDQTNPGSSGWMQSDYEPQQLAGSNAVGSRFGMSVLAAGDIDRNGYDDIVVGAPLEGDSFVESGAVYIYYGSNQGLSEQHKQKILGKVVTSSLRYFGMSLTSTDVESNGYTDVVVGAPYSDSVVVLRSRTIVDVTASIILTPNVIDVLSCVSNRNNPCTRIRGCIRAQHRVNGDPNVFDMDLNFVLDSVVANPALKRFTFFREKSNFKYEPHRTITSSEVCVSYDVQLNVNALGLVGTGGAFEVSPTVAFSYDFTQDHKDTVLSAVLDPVIPNNVFSDWSFRTGCFGINGRCDHDLSASASFSNPPLIFDRNPGVLTASITIRNDGPDYSYFTKVNITSGELSINRYAGSCVVLSDESTSGNAVFTFSNTTTVLNDLMLNGQLCTFVVEYDLTSLTEKATTREIIINGVIYSNAGGQKVAFDVNTENNKFSFRQSVRYSASLLVSGSSTPESLFYNRSETPNIARTLVDPVLGGKETNIQHTRFIYNQGPLLVPASPMTFKWAAATINQFPLLYLYDFKCEPEDKCLCDTRNKVNSLNLPISNITFPPIVSLRFPSSFETILKKTLTCDDVVCGVITCTLSKIPAYSSVTLTTYFKVWLPTLSQPGLVTDLFSNLIIDTSTLPLHPPNIVYTSEVYTRVSAYISPTSNQANLSTDIGAIIGGIIGGIALLCITVLVMWKTGFFKSKYGQLKLQAQQSIRTSQRNNTELPYTEIQ